MTKVLSRQLCPKRYEQHVVCGFILTLQLQETQDDTDVEEP
jgi:hypothetical protein